MKTFTITEAKKQLGALLKRAAAGEDIAVISGADILAFRKVEVSSTDRHASTSMVLREDPAVVDWLPVMAEFEGSGLVDGSINHDKYLYDERR